MIFQEKLYFEVFEPKWAQNEPKIRFLKFCEKIVAWNFSDFLDEVTLTLRLKIDSNDFFGGKSLALEYSHKKWGKMSFFITSLL